MERNNEDLSERGLGLDIDLDKEYLIIAIRFIFSSSIKERLGTKSIIHLDNLEKNKYEYLLILSLNL